jgi:cellulose synthase/poly-beta-1,6-N-acetylglucosamine synthase-like glycosyltransferase
VTEQQTSAAWSEDRPPPLSVVVSTYGRAGFLPSLFASLEAQTLPLASFELIVVDDASTDRTWETLGDLVAATVLPARALRLARNAGQGAGRNAGVAVARGEVVAFTDDDCLPTSSWLERLTEPFTSAPGAPPAVVAQGQTQAWPDDADGAGAWARTVWVLRPTWLFETCNIAYRRTDLVRVGGFPSGDDAPVGPHGRIVGEDAIAGWRVAENGAELVFVPEALVHHRHLPASYLDWLAEQRGRGSFPGLVDRSPLGRRALWRWWFLAPRTAAFDVATVALVGALSSRRARWLIGIVPWVILALPEARSRTGRRAAVRLVQLFAGDSVGAAALVSASIRNRSVVL